jgi:hypothetical protein
VKVKAQELDVQDYAILQTTILEASGERLGCVRVSLITCPVGKVESDALGHLYKRHFGTFFGGVNPADLLQHYGT